MSYLFLPVILLIRSFTFYTKNNSSGEVVSKCINCDPLLMEVPDMEIGFDGGRMYMEEAVEDLWFSDEIPDVYDHLDFDSRSIEISDLVEVT